jgi:hypothetical protein
MIFETLQDATTKEWPARFFELAIALSDSFVIDQFG